MLRISSSLILLDFLFTFMSVIYSLPYVNVPVLSKAIMSIYLAIYRLSIFLIKIPFFDPTPTPTVIAVGVAKPIPQGQATTKTETKKIKDLNKF